MSRLWMRMGEYLYEHIESEIPFARTLLT
jgi:hypothetical protein